MDNYRHLYPKSWYKNLRKMYTPLKITEFSFEIRDKTIIFQYMQDNYKQNSIIQANHLIQTLDEIHYLEYMGYIFNRTEKAVLGKYLKQFSREKVTKKYGIRKSHIKKLKNVKTESKTYIIKCEHTGYYKIGKSKNPHGREKTLQSEKPTVKIIKIFDKDIEKELHNTYKNQRVRGEWFNLSKIQVEYIIRHNI